MKHNEKILALTAVSLALAWTSSPALDDSAPRLVSHAHSRGPMEMTRPPSALVQLANSVSRGPASERAAFARTAILTMAEQYWQEVGKARRQPESDPERRRKASRWSAATLEYLDGLYGTADRIDEFTVIEVLAGPSDSVQLIVDGAPVVLSGPRIGDPGALGREIVREFCRLHDCVLDALVGHQAVRSVRNAPDDTRSRWSFADGDGTTFVTDDGIHFMFTSARDRHRKQQAAMALMHDVRKVAAALMDVADQGYAIDWDRIRLADSLVAGEHKLVVGRHGDYLLLRVPSLGRSAAFFRTSLSWIRSRVEGRNLKLYVPHAEQVLAALLDE